MSNESEIAMHEKTLLNLKNWIKKQPHLMHDGIPTINPVNEAYSLLAMLIERLKVINDLSHSG